MEIKWITREELLREYPDPNALAQDEITRFPYFDAVFPGGKTGREIARQNLKRWAEGRD